MKISTFKRIIKEDVKEEYRDLVEKIAFAVNPFAEEVVKALDNNLNIDDNLNQKIREVNIEVNNSGIPKQLLRFKTNLPSVCKGILVLKVDNITNATTYPTGYPFPSFVESDGLITINHITGLPADNIFKLRLLLYP